MDPRLRGGDTSAAWWRAKRMRPIYGRLDRAPFDSAQGDRCWLRVTEIAAATRGAWSRNDGARSVKNRFNL